MTIRFYRQGERAIIVVEDCRGDTAVAVNRLIGEILMAGEQPIEEKPVPGLEPVETPEEPMPDLDTATPITGPEDLFPEPIPEEEAMNTAVEGPARTLRGAIQQKDTTAIIRLLRMQKESCVALTVNRICRNYIEQDLNYRDPNTADAAEIRLFFEVYNDYLKEAALKILSATGFNDMDTFFRMNTEDVLHEAYYSFIEVVRRNL